MKKFRVWAKYASYCYLDVEAENKDEAYKEACEADGGDFIPNDNIDSWEVELDSIEELQQ